MIWNLVRFILFILLAIHLGWSWWLVALLIIVIEPNYTAR